MGALYPPHVQRMLEEQTQLTERLVKLSTFATMTNPTFASLSEEDRVLLVAQADAMRTYGHILTLRITRAVASIPLDTSGYAEPLDLADFPVVDDLATKRFDSVESLMADLNDEAPEPLQALRLEETEAVEIGGHDIDVDGPPEFR